MCTMTWLLRADGYELFFNRDEAHTRLTARPPEIRMEKGVAYIAPIDADAGGTWMGVNAFGVSLCLLNGRGAGVPERRDYTSRGLLVLALMDCRDRDSVFARLAAMDLTVFRAFTLAVLEPGRAVATWAWFGGGRTRVVDDAVCPLISSSFRLPEVAETRRQLFRSLGDCTVAQLVDFHRSHVPEAGPLSVCLHRSDARSVSLSRVRVSAEQVEFFYAPGAPCETEFLPPVTLSRAALHVDANAR